MAVNQIAKKLDQFTKPLPVAPNNFVSSIVTG